MPSIYTSREEDERVLEILDARFSQGMQGKEIRDTFGLTKGAVAGIMHRFRESEEPCACKKPENRDGGMPARWWAKWPR